MTHPLQVSSLVPPQSESRTSVDTDVPFPVNTGHLLVLQLPWWTLMSQVQKYMFCSFQTISLAHPSEDHLRVYTPDHLRVGLAFWEEGLIPEGVPAQDLSW